MSGNDSTNIGAAGKKVNGGREREVCFMAERKNRVVWLKKKKQNHSVDHFRRRIPNKPNERENLMLPEKTVVDSKHISGWRCFLYLKAAKKMCAHGGRDNLYLRR